jgi:hypothetical protein
MACLAIAALAVDRQLARADVCPGGQCPAPLEPVVDARPIARVVSERGQARTLGTGTLVDVFDGRGLLVTCAHVLGDGADRIVITFPDGRGYAANLLKLDAGADLAALEIAAPAARPVVVAERFPRPGEVLTSCGYGSDGRLWCNRGQALGYVTTAGRAGREVLELAGAARLGDSGGPVLNGDGHLVAVLFGTNGRVVDGTFCGRVRQFLAGLSPRFRRPAPQLPPETKPPLAGPREVDPPLVDGPPPVVVNRPPPKLPEPRSPEVDLPPGADPRPRVSPLEEAARPWLAAKLTALLVAFGLPGGIAGIGGAAAAWFVMRRGRKRLEAEIGRLRARLGETTSGLATGATSDKAVERHHNRFVPYEVGELDKAWSAAHARVGEKYPGAVPYLKIVESVKEQLLSGVAEHELF